MTVSNNKINSVVCFGDSDWWYHNRGHMDIQMMKRFAGMGEVLYINSIVVRKFNVQEGAMFFRRVKRKLKSIIKGLQPSGIENMMVYSPFTMPVHHIRIAKQLNQFILRLQIRRCIKKLGFKNSIVWVACPGAAEVAVKLPYDKLVYQRSDRYEEFPGVDSEQMIRYDHLLKKHSDLVVYVNRELMEQEKADCRKAVFLDHGVDYEIFANARKNPDIPEEMKDIPHPILGFYGSFDEHTTDIPLVEKIADILSDISIVLIGHSNVDLTSLISRKNVYMLEQQPYERIAQYAKCFDVCFMPWRQNEWIKACNPIKLKEYLALGKPVVSTPFPELNGYCDVVYVAKTPDEFADSVMRALKENCSERISAGKQKVQNSSWDSKAQSVLDQLYKLEEIKTNPGFASSGNGGQVLRNVKV